MRQLVQYSVSANIQQRHCHDIKVLNYNQRLLNKLEFHKMNEYVTMVIGADIAPTHDNYELFINNDVDKLVGKKVLEILKSSDYRIFNLESPLTDRLTPIKKSGPNLYAKTETVRGMKKLGIDLVTLANNHVRDQGEYGIKSTICTLKNEKIDYIGVGSSIENVIKSKIVEIKDIKIGVYACAEHEYSIVEKNQSGANPFDYIDTFYDISMLKKVCDCVIVLFHGGTELYRYPTPLIQRICRHMVDSGADIVLLQHTHCIGTYEEYKFGTIVYGQGNFIFNNSESEVTKTSLLVQLKISKSIGKKIVVNYIPLEKTMYGVKIAEGEKAKDIIDKFKDRSRDIVNQDILKRKFSEFSKVKMRELMYILGGRFTNNRLFRLLDKCCGGRLLKMIYTEGYLLFIKDLFMCESYQEMMSSNILDNE